MCGGGVEASARRRDTQQTCRIWAYVTDNPTTRLCYVSPSFLVMGHLALSRLDGGPPHPSPVTLHASTRGAPCAPVSRDSSAVSRVSNYSIKPCIHDATLSQRFGAKHSATRPASEVAAGSGYSALLRADRSIRLVLHAHVLLSPCRLRAAQQPDERHVAVVARHVPRRDQRGGGDCVADLLAALEAAPATYDVWPLVEGGA